jgi:hypothetical protein
MNEDQESRRRFIAASSVLGAAGAMYSAAPLAAGAILKGTQGIVPAELILHNGRLHTVDREQPQATAVAIREGRFVLVAIDANRKATPLPKA